MDKRKYSWSGKSSREAGSEVSVRMPTETSWGYYGCDDLIGCFLWFESWPELLEFIGEHEVNLGDQSNGEENPDREETRADVRRIIVALLAGRLAVAEGLTQLNSALVGSGSRVLWWGQINELLEGSGEFAKEVRLRFRDNPEDPAVPINRAELGKFLNFLPGFSDRA